jgi:ER degradation enhancer, mannosidase alpha-like 2
MMSCDCGHSTDNELQVRYLVRSVGTLRIAKLYHSCYWRYENSMLSSPIEIGGQSRSAVQKRRLSHPKRDDQFEVEEFVVFHVRRRKARRIVLVLMFLSLLFTCQLWNIRGSIYGGTVWLVFAAIAISSGAAVEGKRDERHGPSQHPKNIVEQLWHKLQQVASQKESLSRQKHGNPKSLFDNREMSLSSIDVSNLKQIQEIVLSTSQHDWVQSLFQQQQPQQTAITAPVQRDKQPPQYKSIAVSSRKRRRALYKHSLQQHYAKLYLDSVRNAGARNSTHEEVAFNETLWNTVSNAFHTYTHNLHRETSHNTIRSISDEKLDRTTSLHTALAPFPKSSVRSNRQLIRNMFQHGYDSYMYHAFPAGEIRPISCQPGTFDLVRIPALTVFDSLDTLLLLGNVTEFARAVERIRKLHVLSPKKSIFAIDQNVSVFETNIRVLGGLISAHQLALAYHLDTPTFGSSKLRPESEFILQLDVFDAAGDIRWGSLEHKADPLSRWRRYQHGDDGELSFCSAADASFIDALADSMSISSVASCDSSSFSLSYSSIPFSGFAVHSNVCYKQGNTTSTSETIPLSDYWTYDGFLLDLALDIGKRLLPAFSTITGIPYGTVNLLYGVPSDETTVASLAGGGTLSLEFELLSRLSGDTRFGRAARLASRALFRHRSRLNLFGKHIDVSTGTWVETLSGIGSNSDSFLEYLAKHYMLFPEDDDFWIMFKTAYGGVFNESRLGEWYADVDLNSGVSSGNGRRVFESLAAFYPGLQVLLGEITPAARTLNSFFIVREILGFLPERFNYGVWNLDHGRDGAGIHPLRPELLESCYLMHRATKGIHSKLADSDIDQQSGWEWAADFALHKLESATRAPCGYAGLREVKPHTTGAVDGSNVGMKHMNEMPSFFLSETLKYLFLIFDDDNVLHRDSNRQWIFTTEAHPVHYAPQKSPVHPSSARRELTAGIASLKIILQRRVRSIRKLGHSNRSKYDDSFFKGRWTKVVDNRSYRDDIQSIVNEGSNAILSEIFPPIDSDVVTSNQVMPFIPSGPFLHDTFGESLRKENVAHLAFGNWGASVNLQRHCTNLYTSELLWLHAINGGATDYSDSYVSTGHDTLIEDPHFFAMFGAADALGAVGAGIYVDESNLEHVRCPISLAANEIVPEKVEEVFVADDSPVQIASEIGNFEVSTFPNGGGFHVRHVENDEFVIANFIADENPDIGQIAIVHTEICTNKWKSMAKDTSRDDEVKDQGMQLVREKRRQTSIVDFHGHSFTCKVHVFRRRKKSTEENEQDEIFSTIPCAPAMFGPTHISLLKEQKEIDIEAFLSGPRENNLNGCNVGPSPKEDPIAESFIQMDSGVVNDISASSEDSEASAIHLVHRGECTFFEKAMHMHKMWSIDALIVINSSEEMFMMSAGEDEIGDVDPNDVPVSVLISQTDGAALLEILQNESAIDSPSSVFARISIEQQFFNQNIQDELANRNDSIDWPIVRGNSNELNVLAEFGWGIHALIKSEGQHRECEISIVRHSFDEGT